MVENRVRILAVALGAFVAAAPFSSVAGGSGLQSSPECASTPVHWQPRKNIGTRAGLVMPWISASPTRARVIGYLLYYTRGSAIDVLHLPGVVIYTRGRTPEGGTTSIIWVVGRNSGRYLYFSGRRLDGPGSFKQRSGFQSAGTFPSQLRVPSPGCWRVTLHGLNVRAQVTFRAFDGPP